MGSVFRVTPRPRITREEGTPGIRCTGGWVGLWAVLETKARWKILSPVPGIEPPSPGRPVRSQTLYWLSYPAPFVSLGLQITINKVLLVDDTRQSFNLTEIFVFFRSHVVQMLRQSVLLNDMASAICVPCISQCTALFIPLSSSSSW
jgi:hypothetical protein